MWSDRRIRTAQRLKSVDARSPITGAAVAWLAVLALPAAAAEKKPDTLRQRSAQVVSAMRPIGRLACESRGSGLSVGAGLVLTAAHVLLDRSDVARGCKLPAWALSRFGKRPGDPFMVRIAVGGRPAAAAVVVATGRRTVSAIHTMSFAASGDFAILRGATRANVLSPCDGTPAPGRAVVVVLPERLVATRVAAAQTVKSGDDAAYIDLEDVFEQGTSGAGVLDAETSCVWGLISHRFPEPRPRVTRMTPVGVFAAAWRKAL